MMASGPVGLRRAGGRKRSWDRNADERQELDASLTRSMVGGCVRHRDCSRPRRWSLPLVSLGWVATSTVLVLAAAAPVFAADAERGRRIYERCSSCHVLNEERSVFGPHLKGIIGRRAGGHPDYSYSDAMRTAGEAGLVWDEQALSDFLHNPKKKVPGTKMRFWGLWRSEIEDLMAYLTSVK